MIVKEKTVQLKNSQLVVLRSPIVKDAKLLLDNLQCVLHESYKNMNEPADRYDDFPIEEEEKILETFSNTYNRFMISAFHDGKIVANLGVVGSTRIYSRHSASVGMGIRQSYQNKGLGFQLLNYAIETSREIGLKRLELTVRTFNKSGIRLYEKLDFQKVGLLKKAAFIDEEFHDEFSYQLIL